MHYRPVFINVFWLARDYFGSFGVIMARSGSLGVIPQNSNTDPIFQEEQKQRTNPFFQESQNFVRTHRIFQEKKIPLRTDKIFQETMPPRTDNF